MIEHTGKKTPGVDGALWDTPEKKAAAINRIGRWRGYRPKPLRRVDIPKSKGKRRPLSIPAMEDRARQAVSLQALQPIADTSADRNSYGFRPKRRGADAIDQCFKVLRQKTAARWIVEGDIEGFFDTIAFSWREAHIPMTKRVLSKWLRSGFIDNGRLFPTTTGVPQGGLVSPVISNMVLAGLEAVVHGKPWHRRVHNINFVRWADDLIVTANSRQVLEETVLPRMNAFLAARGVRLSAEKTIITPLAQGFDFLGHTIRKHERPHGKPATLQIVPSRASYRAITTKIKALCKQAKGLSPAQLIATLNPVLRGWANYHRHVICSESFTQLDSFVWRRLFRWAKLRHPNKTGHWVAARYFPHKPGESWRFTDPDTGKQILRIREVVKPQRYHKVKGDANPFDPTWEAYFQHRDRQLLRQASSPGRAKILTQQSGRCPVCRQVLQCEATLELHHRDAHHQNNRLGNLILLHPNCHRQVHYAPDSKAASLRPARGVGHA